MQSCATSLGILSCPHPLLTAGHRQDKVLRPRKQHALPRRHALALASEFSDSFAMRKNGKREFSVVVERDEAGYYVASVPALPGCHTQARSLDKLMERIREAIELCLEVESESVTSNEFIGVQLIAV